MFPSTTGAAPQHSSVRLLRVAHCLAWLAGAARSARPSIDVTADGRAGFMIDGKAAFPLGFFYLYEGVCRNDPLCENGTAPGWGSSGSSGAAFLTDYAATYGFTTLVKGWWTTSEYAAMSSYVHSLAGILPWLSVQNNYDISTETNTTRKVMLATSMAQALSTRRDFFGYLVLDEPGDLQSVAVAHALAAAVKFHDSVHPTWINIGTRGFPSNATIAAAADACDALSVDP